MFCWFPCKFAFEIDHFTTVLFHVCLPVISNHLPISCVDPHPSQKEHVANGHRQALEAEQAQQLPAAGVQNGEL